MSRAGTGLGTGCPGTAAGSEAPEGLMAVECQRIRGSGGGVLLKRRRRTS